MIGEIEPNGDILYVYVFSGIGLFILLIACFNYTNLSTARSMIPAKEVGIRKVIGAEKSQLIGQFLGESLLMTFIAFIIALAMTILVLPLFRELSGRQISISFSGDKFLLLGFLAMALLTGIVAGSYPAFYLSSFNPVKVLKGKLANSLAVLAVRKGLVVFQFIISVVLIIASLVIARQMHYMRIAELGFAKDQQIIIPMRSAMSKSKYIALENEIKSNSEVIATGASMFYPGVDNAYDAVYYKDGQTMNNAKYTKMNYIDDEFMHTLQLQAVAGRLFSPLIHSDTASNRIILNETAVKEIGFESTEKAIGQNVHYDVNGKTYSFQVIGVVKDFHFQDFHVSVAPYGFQMASANSPFNYITIHVRPGGINEVLKLAANAWRKYDPAEPFEYSFLDETFQKNYLDDDRLASIVGYFTAIAILISCLGLFGLAAFSAEQRIKEIGIRKVLGASVKTIVTLLSADFLKLIILSVIIASPIAWWAMNKWLQGFAYRQAIDWSIFAYTTVIALTIGLFTIGTQALKAALANPVKSLRSE